MKKKILVVDDEVILVEEIAEILEDENYLVDTANDVISANELLKKNTYNLVLLDLKMPGGGHNILKQSKSEKPDLKIMIISGSEVINRLQSGAGSEQEEEITNLADDFMGKPFDIEEMLKKVTRLIS
jgi:DNA-binding NtrC family response regulator